MYLSMIQMFNISQNREKCNFFNRISMCNSLGVRSILGNRMTIFPTIKYIRKSWKRKVFLKMLFKNQYLKNVRNTITKSDMMPRAVYATVKSAIIVFQLRLCPVFHSFLATNQTTVINRII